MTARSLVIALSDPDENNSLTVRQTLHRLPSVRRVLVMSDADSTVSYLRGEGRYSDRGTWPFPSVVVLQQELPGLSGLDTLHQLRSDPCLAALPAVVLGGAFSRAQLDLAASLRAAPCVTRDDPDLMAAELDRAIRTALSLGRRVALEAATGCRWRGWPVSRADERIRVWT